MTTQTQIMIVEDEAILALGLKRKLQAMGYNVPTTVSSGEEAVQTVTENCPDLILMDIRLNGRMDGIEAAEQIRIRFGTPVVYLTAYSDNGTLQRAKITEPFGYLLKPFNKHELRVTIETALYKYEIEKTLRQRNRELALLNQAGQAFNSSLDVSQVLVIALEKTRELLDVLTCSIWLVEPETGELVCRHVTCPHGKNVHNWRLEAGAGIAQQTMTNGRGILVSDAWHNQHYNLDLDKKDGLGLHSILSVPLQVKSEIIGVLQVADTKIGRFATTDLTVLEPLAASAAIAIENARLFALAQQEIAGRKQAELEQKTLQTQLLQAQKMEAIGRLAAGIAHDFNNVLTAINGFAELLQRRLPADSPHQQLVGHIAKAGERAAGLIRQLMVFSKRQADNVISLNLNTVIYELEITLRRIIREDIEIALNLTSDPWLVKIDPANIEQIIINLAVNARDAMPMGGKLTIGTANIKLDKKHDWQFLNLAAGNYVKLWVGDEGEGMKDEVKTRVFEPFFTTKGEEQGTGLGLSICHGIVKQNNGHITVDSRPQQGTTFEIYLPQANSHEYALSMPDDEAKIQSLQGTETILLAEDETAVRVLVTSVLTDLGYNLIEAMNGQEALQLAREHDGPIDLLLTDVVMPQMGGKELAEQLQVLHPKAKMIFISGYTEEEMAQFKDEHCFIQKPFSPHELAKSVRKILNRER